MDEKLIEKQAKEIMDRFFAVLSKVSVDEEDNDDERIEKLRDANNPSCEPSFSDSFFLIAVKKDKDFFIAEKAKWK